MLLYDLGQGLGPGEDQGQDHAEEAGLGPEGVPFQDPAKEGGVTHALYRVHVIKKERLGGEVTLPRRLPHTHPLALVLVQVLHQDLGLVVQVEVIEGEELAADQELL